MMILGRNDEKTYTYLYYDNAGFDWSEYAFCEMIREIHTEQRNDSIFV